MATKWGVVGTGKISHDFVTAVQSIPEGGHEFVAVSCQNLSSAQEFANNHNIPKAYGSYEELAKDTNVEVVYICTINPYHFKVGKLMLENEKHVLCEKPMTVNAKQTKALIALAKKHKRFLMEAIWSRFFPASRTLMALINKGTIGDVLHIDGNFGIPVMDLPRLMKKELGGGTILDLGIYNINIATLIYGENPLKIAAVGHLNNERVDIAMSASLLYSNNRTANVTSNAQAEFPCDLVITGTKGIIRVPKPFWCPTAIHTDAKTYEFPLPETIRSCNFVNSSGLRYEAMEVRECIQKGKLESSIMPLKDSETVAEIMDDIRHQIGFFFSEDEMDPACLN